MQKDTIITISGTQFAALSPEKETMTTTAEASYHYRDQKHYVMYDEVIDGDRAIVNNTVKITDDRIEIIKKGAVNVRLGFKEGQKTLSTYILPFGSLMLGIFTKELKLDVSDNLIRCKIDYELEVSEEHISDCVIDMTIANKTAK